MTKLDICRNDEEFVVTKQNAVFLNLFGKKR